SVLRGLLGVHGLAAGFQNRRGSAGGVLLDSQESLGLFPVIPRQTRDNLLVILVQFPVFSSAQGRARVG
ncbi:MAG: hypothetical protein R6U98_06025, partial [Pirellulaceae bacterium]